jgi:hypothetical protein
MIEATTHASRSTGRARHAVLVTAGGGDIVQQTAPDWHDGDEHAAAAARAADFMTLREERK